MIKEKRMTEFVVRFAFAVMVLGIGIVSLVAPSSIPLELSLAAGVSGVLMLIDPAYKKDKDV